MCVYDTLVITHMHEGSICLQYLIIIEIYITHVTYIACCDVYVQREGMLKDGSHLAHYHITIRLPLVGPGLYLL